MWDTREPRRFQTEVRLSQEAEAILARTSLLEINGFRYELTRELYKADRKAIQKVLRSLREVLLLGVHRDRLAETWRELGVFRKDHSIWSSEKPSEDELGAAEFFRKIEEFLDKRSPLELPFVRHVQGLLEQCVENFEEISLQSIGVHDLKALGNFSWKFFVALESRDRYIASSTEDNLQNYFELVDEFARDVRIPERVKNDLQDGLVTELLWLKGTEICDSMELYF